VSDVALTELGAGARAVVSAVAGSPARVDKLAALGILPGVELLVQQRTPVYVIECGETTLAVEQDLAKDIRVAVVNASSMKMTIKTTEPHAHHPPPTGQAMRFVILFLIAAAGLVACGDAATPRRTATSESARNARSPRDVTAIHRSRCGSCHVRVEPGARTHAQLDDALARHHKRVAMSDAEWSNMIDYLAAAPPTRLVTRLVSSARGTLKSSVSASGRRPPGPRAPPRCRRRAASPRRRRAAARRGHRPPG